MKTKKAAADLPEKEVLRAATNSPTLSEDSFLFAGKTYKIVDLSYDHYITFVSLLKPVLEGVFSHLAPANVAQQLELPQKLDIYKLIGYCADQLPELVRIVIAQTEPEVTLDFVKQNHKSPFNLATIVMKQIIRNGIIRDFTDFFAQAAPLLETMTGSSQ